MIANNRAGHRRPAPWTDHPRTWYTLERWRRLRRHQLNKQPVCEMCLERGLVRVATVADHIEDHRNWNEFLTGKLRSLCRECHEIRHGRLLVPTEIGEDGWPKQSGGGPPTIDDVSASGLRARRGPWHSGNFRPSPPGCISEVLQPTCASRRRATVAVSTLLAGELTYGRRRPISESVKSVVLYYTFRHPKRS